MKGIVNKLQLPLPFRCLRRLLAELAKAPPSSPARFDDISLQLFLGWVEKIRTALAHSRTPKGSFLKSCHWHARREARSTEIGGRRDSLRRLSSPDRVVLVLILGYR